MPPVTRKPRDVTAKINLDRHPAILSVSDLAHFLGLSENTLRGRVRNGLVPRPRKERHGQPPRWRFVWHRDEIADWLKGQIAANMRDAEIEVDIISSGGAGW